LSEGGKEQEQEYVIVVIWMNEGECVIINYYTPCRKLELGQITQIIGLGGNKLVVCGDFNAHSTLWGGIRTDATGEVIEELLEERNMVCLNDGRGTRIDTYREHFSIRFNFSF